MEYDVLTTRDGEAAAGPAAAAAGRTLAADPGDEHGRLVAEMPAVQRLPIGERLLLARRRRLEQVTRYERWQRRDAAAGSARRTTNVAAAAAVGSSRRSVCFDGAVSLLEAVHRDDIDEGWRSTLFRLDALALSVIATATWLAGWVAGCLSQPVLYQND